MRVIVAGGLRNPILLDTTEATALLITNNEGTPNVIYKLLENDKGWIRFTQGEDKNFNEVARDLGLVYQQQH
jgi:hypothetical protein